MLGKAAVTLEEGLKFCKMVLYTYRKALTPQEPLQSFYHQEKQQ